MEPAFGWVMTRIASHISFHLELHYESFSWSNRHVRNLFSKKEAEGSITEYLKLL